MPFITINFLECGVLSQATKVCRPTHGDVPEASPHRIIFVLGRPMTVHFRSNSLRGSGCSNMRQGGCSTFPVLSLGSRRCPVTMWYTYSPMLQA